MRHVELCFFVCCILGSVCSAGFDYLIQDTYRLGTIDLDGQSLLVLGAGAGWIDARGPSYVEVHDTARPLELNVGGIWTMDLRDSSSVKHLGGETMEMMLTGHATAVLKGGRIDYISSRQYVLSSNQNYIPHIEIICREYDSSNPNLITGIWDADNDGDGEYDTFAINLVNQAGYDPVIENIKFTIPEPASFLLIGLGGLLLRRRS